MAALLLTAAASAFTTSFGITGLTASIIGAAATAAGTFIDLALFGGPTIKQSFEGPRLSDSQITTSTEGAPILRVYGRYRVGGQIIWATRLEEEVVTETTKSGGKGGGGGSETTTTTYKYYANFAIGICEGVVGSLGRVWADGKEIDLTDYTYRFYRGTETQTPDSLLETKDGSGNIPGYRGLCYIVFERVPLEKFGNRVPQMLFEILRPVTENNSLETRVPGVNLIPGTTEFGYDPVVIKQQYKSSSGQVTSEAIENAHLLNGKSDWDEAIDQLEQTLTGLNIVCFVVTWFGNDLRAGNCTIKPRVESSTKQTSPHSWYVAGLDRTSADIISQYLGKPAFGGTPNDASVIRAIQDLKARGYEVMFYPFIIMDIPAGNTLPNPYSANGAGVGQAVYPWRGRITCHPAPGQTGTVDKTGTAGTQIASFYGSATAAHFGGSGTTVIYSGPNQWSYSRFVLHMAQLCKLAGGVEYFCVGSELVGLTSVRSSSSTFPFVANLVTLAGHVRTLLPTTKIGYAADWSEYHSYRPADGTNDVYFNMDQLWSNANIDFIGFDNYMKLADWRDGTDHLDYLAGHPSIYDIDYLKSNIEGGEDYDWYYASDSDRVNQIRTPINDAAYSKHWVFRQKDFRNWWLSQHYDRPAGVESGSPTSWTPQSKPIFFTELGCPAVDKGANQPNVFVDPKSSESFLPYFSSGSRDDVIQRRFLQAHFDYWDPTAGNNPISGVYGGRMLDQTRINVWAWDARPWPTFPLDGNSWADKPNWQYGHWLNTRMGTVYVPDLLTKLAEDYGFTNYDFSRAYGSCDGYVVDSVMSIRGAVEPLELMFFFNLIESGDKIKAASKHEVTPRATITLSNALAQGDGKEVLVMTRKQETEIPATVNIKFIDASQDYKSAAVQAQRLTVSSDGVSNNDVPIIIDFARAQQNVEQILYDIWGAREGAAFGVLPSLVALEPGDVVTLSLNDFTQDVRIQQITDGTGRAIDATTFDRSAWISAPSGDRTTPLSPDTSIAAPIALIMDLPLLLDSDTEHAAYTAGYARPWPTGINVYRSSSTSNYALNTVIAAAAKIGETLTPLAAGPEGRWDYANTLDIELYNGEIASADELSVLAGANSLAVETGTGWEIIQFCNATLIGSGQYRISKLGRAKKGTEGAMQTLLPAGQRVIVLDLAVQQLSMSLSDLNRLLYYKYGPASKPISDPTYTSLSTTLRGNGMRPYSPEHVRGRLSGADWVITWKRRTRIGGDDWEYTTDVPLSEAFERYEVDVLSSGGAVVRTITVSAPSATYTSAQQATDGITAPFDVIVYQISEKYGRGTGRRKTISG